MSKVKCQMCEQSELGQMLFMAAYFDSKFRDRDIKALKRELRPFIRNEIKIMLWELIKRRREEEDHPPEDTIKESFIERVKKAEQEVESKQYSPKDILEL